MDSDAIMQIVLSIVSIILAYYVVPWLKAKIQDYKLQQNADVLSGLQAIMYTCVANAIYKEYPKIAERIKNDGTVTADEVKESLYGIGTVVLEKVRQSAKDLALNADGISDVTLGEMMRAIVDELSPFGGKEASKMFVQPGAASKMLEEGVRPQEKEDEDE